MADETCDEEVTRKGMSEPCEKTAVARRIDREGGTSYPVCVKHTRAPMVPLANTPRHPLYLRSDATLTPWGESRG